MKSLALLALLIPGLALADPPPLLIRDATVITMNPAGELPHQDVLIRQRRIERIAPAGSIDMPADAVVVHADGRFLMPGLAEMHAHVPGPEPAGYAEEVLLLFAAHGVTTIRGMLGHPSHLELRRRIAAGDVLGPRLFTSGPSFNGNSAPDPETAQRMVREQKTAGYDFLKLHPGLSREVFDAIVETAVAAGMPYSGHVSDDVGLTRALGARQSAIDHLDGYMQALVEPDCLKGPVAAGFFGIGLAGCASESRIPAVVAATVAAGTWMAPTQVLLEQWAAPPSVEALRSRPALAYLPARVVDQWVEARRGFLGLQAMPAGQAARFIALRRELLRQLHAAGVPILLASDAPQVFNVPGDSTLAELELYGQIGLAPMAALATGTVNPAWFFGQQAVFGTVREGLEADLLLLDADPRQDLGAVRRLAGVVLRGRWLSRNELDTRLKELAGRNRPTG